MPINAGEIIEVVYEGTLLGQKILNTLHYKVTVPSGTPSVLTALGFFGATFTGGSVSPTLAFLNCLPQNYTLDRIRFQKITAPRSIASYKNIGLPGTRPVNVESSNQAIVISKRAEVAGRHNIGSLHLAGVAQQDMDMGKVGFSLLAQMSILASKMANLVPATGDPLEAVPVILNRLNPALSELLYQPYPQTTVRTMRRRTVGLGI